MATKKNKSAPTKPLLAPGSTVLIRTVTMTLTGRVVRRDKEFIELEDPAWIADTGRFADALRTGNLNEVEPTESNVLVGIGSIVDVWHWEHALPRTQV
jgi:hypothetical protein